MAIDGSTDRGAGTGGVPVLADLFAPLGVLDPDTRATLDELVATPGSAVAITPADLTERPLPSDREARSCLASAIASALTSHVARALVDHRIDAVVPALRWPAADDIVAAIAAPRHHATSGRDLRTLTVGEAAGPTGRATKPTIALLTALVTAGLDTIARVAPPASAPTLDDVVVVLAAGGEAVRRAIGDVAAHAPPDVRAAAARLLRLPAEDARLRHLRHALAAAGDIRDRAVFEHGVLGLGSTVTRHELGASLGIGYERVRQLALRATTRVDEALDELPTELVDLAAELVHLLGSAVPLAAVDHVLDALALPALPDTRSRLLLRFAGPYRAVEAHPGWAATDPAELVGETRRLIHDDGGVNLLADVTRGLAAVGVHGEHVAAWLRRQPVAMIDDLVVLRTGGAATVAERMLHAVGRPIAIDEVNDWLPDSGGTRWWTDSRFVLDRSGALTLAEWRTSTTVSDTLAPTLRVVVDHDVLTGSHGPLAPAIAAALGLRPGAHRTLTTAFGPVAVIHDGETPARGSLRPIALAVGATLGDELAISIYPDGRGAEVSIVRPLAADRQGEAG